MDKVALAAWLHAQMPGLTITSVVGQAVDWVPQRGRCHDNAALWISRNPGHQRAAVWLPAPYETFDNRLRFLAHSVVETPDGALIDVTLSPVDLHRVIRHPWDETAFYAAVSENRLASIDHVMGPDPEIEFGSAALTLFPDPSQF